MSVNVSTDLYLAVNALAKESGEKIGPYVRALLEFAVKHNLSAIPNADEERAWEAAVKQGAPLPKKRIEIAAQIAFHTTAKVGTRYKSHEGDDTRALRAAEEPKKKAGAK